MTGIKKQKLKRTIFPIGVFFVLFLLESIIGIAGVGSYIFLAGKKNIADIENYTINYSKTMAEAFANIAEFSYSEKNDTALKALFREEIEKNIIDEAFFVLANGKIVVHSDKTIAERLKWDIGNDKMSYNSDMILKPVQEKSNDFIYDNYNITDNRVPFKKWRRDILSKYVYEHLNTTGWLFTKCVFHKGKPVGTVNFIISKERIYTSIRESIDMLKYYSILIMVVSAIVSLFISLIIFFRYRSILLNALFYDTYEDYSDEYDHSTKVASKDDNIELSKKHSKALKNDFDDFDMIDNEIENMFIEKMQKENLTEVHETKRGYSQIDDDESITIEFLGEIESNQGSAEKRRIERVKEYISPAVNINEKKSINKEIRDAIPIRRNNR